MPESDLDAEYIDGDIMINFKEGSRANEELAAPTDPVFDLAMFVWHELEDPFPILFWDSATRVKVLGRSNRDITQSEDFTKQYDVALLKRDYIFSTPQKRVRTR